MFGFEKQKQLKKEVEALRSEVEMLRKENKQLCCGHSITAHEFVVDNSAIGKNIKRCRHCGKVLRYYYNRTDLMDQDKKTWVKLMEKINGKV